MSGDTIGPRAVDKSVGIMLNVSVVFFQSKETNIYVSLLCTRIKVTIFRGETITSGMKYWLQ